jgi:hypothetical protein
MLTPSRVSSSPSAGGGWVTPVTRSTFQPGQTEAPAKKAAMQRSMSPDSSELFHQSFKGMKSALSVSGKVVVPGASQM